MAGIPPSDNHHHQHPHHPPHRGRPNLEDPYAVYHPQLPLPSPYQEHPTNPFYTAQNPPQHQPPLHHHVYQPHAPRGKRLPPPPPHDPYFYAPDPRIVEGPVIAQHQEQPQQQEEQQGHPTNQDDEEQHDGEDNDDDDDETNEDDDDTKTSHKPKKNWRDYPRYDYHKSQGRKQLQAAMDALQDAKDHYEKCQQQYQLASSLVKERETAYQQKSQEVVDELLESEAPRPWNKMYFRLKDFYEKHGHCLLSVRASTAKRKMAKEKQKNNAKNTTVATTAEGKENEESSQNKQQQPDPPEQDPRDSDTPQPKEEPDDSRAIAREGDSNQNGTADDIATSNNNDVDDKDDIDAKEIGALGRWAAMQRTHRKKGKLEDWKISALNRLEFVWDARDVTWHTTYQELKEFHKQHGHARVLPAQNPSLSRWLRFQRDNYRDFKANGFVERDNDLGMNQQRVELLEALGMDWGNHDERWIVLFYKLQQLALAQGHLKTIPEKKTKLIRFAEKQRAAYKEFMQSGGQDSKDMTTERVLLLNSIQFPWNAEGNIDDDDDDETASSTKKLFPGTPIVASKVLSIGAPNKLNRKQTNENNSNHDDDDWMIHYRKLKAFHQRYHHFNYTDERVATEMPPSETVQLHRWDAIQREGYQELQSKSKKKRGFSATPLTPERVELLDALGFFRPKQDREWAYQMTRLKRFHAQHGHAAILYPGTYAADSPQWDALAQWACTQREEYLKYQSGQPSTLTCDRVNEMTTLGFNWDLSPSSFASLVGGNDEKLPPTTVPADAAAIPLPPTVPEVAETAATTLKRKRGRPRKNPPDQPTTKARKTEEQKGPEQQQLDDTSPPAEETNSNIETTQMAMTTTENSVL